MVEILCSKCGWLWLLNEGETEADCPFCPKHIGDLVFDTDR
jgi:hypothetical protein